jgi:alpha-galactosidase/6-phospho-beta-glucosidase family protein
MSDGSRYQIIGECPGFVKDTHTGAILNTDNASLKAYKQRKKVMAKQTDRLDKLEEDVTQIKHLLSEILGKLS